MPPDAIDLLLTRRSVVAKNLGAPGPDATALRTLLTAAARVPDHKKLEPWRFIVFEGRAREAFGTILAAAAAMEGPDSVRPDKLAEERDRFMRAPTVVCVVASPKSGTPIPEWEQTLSTGAVCQNLLLAANALGFRAQWLTEWYAYSPTVATALGLAAHERVAGFVYIGTPVEEPVERPRPDIDAIMTRWAPPAVDAT